MRSLAERVPEVSTTRPDRSGNIDVLVLRWLRDRRMRNERALLATVVRTWGSSPRPVGSIMALRDDGTVAGSISGGCIEDDLAHCYGRTHQVVAPHVSPNTADGSPIPYCQPLRCCYGVSAIWPCLKL